VCARRTGRNFNISTTASVRYPGQQKHEPRATRLSEIWDLQRTQKRSNFGGESDTKTSLVSLLSLNDCSVRGNLRNEPPNLSDPHLGSGMDSCNYCWVCYLGDLGLQVRAGNQCREGLALLLHWRTRNAALARFLLASEQDKKVDPAHPGKEVRKRLTQTCKGTQDQLAAVRMAYGSFAAGYKTQAVEKLRCWKERHWRSPKPSPRSGRSNRFLTPCPVPKATRILRQLECKIYLCPVRR